MKVNLKSKCLSVVLSMLTIALTTTSSFAHNAVYYDFLVGDNFDYDVIPRDDMQSSSESGHLEWAPEVGGYFYEAGNKENRPLFVYKKGTTSSEKTRLGEVSFRHPGHIRDASAEGDRVKYYENYTRHDGNGGLSILGKAHTLPPTNAINQDTNKYLHLTTQSPELSEVTVRINRMIYAFNSLLYYAAPGENPGDYSGYQTDFMATAEILADAISNVDNTGGGMSITVPIPVDDTKYNSVTIEIKGRTYNWTVIRHDGRKYVMKGAIRTVHTGFKSESTKGDFTFGGSYHKATDAQEDNKWYSSWSSLWTSLRHGVSSKQDYPFRADIGLVNAIITANTKMAVYGTSAKNAYSTRDESILGRELTKAITGVIDTLTSLLKMQDYSELIFNSGARNPQSYVLKFDGTSEYTGEELTEGTLEYSRNDPYFLGIYRLSWQEMVVKFNSIFLVFGLMVIGFSLVKLLLHAQTIALSPYFRHEAYKTILNYIIVALLLPLTWVIFALLAEANYYITSIFGSSVNYESITQIGVSGASGTLGGIAIGVCYFTALVYFNVVYVIRSINIAILMATAPLIISTLTLGGKYKNIFDTWLKEIVANIFLQSFHAFILTFIVSAQSRSNGLEAVVLVLGMIPLTSMFRGMFLGGNTINTGEQLGSKARNVANAGLAATALAGVRLGAAGISGAASVASKGIDTFNNSETFKNWVNSKYTNDEDRRAMHKGLDKLSNKGKFVARNAKPVGENLGKIATGAALSLSTEGQSIQTAMQGLEGLSLSAIDGASKMASNAIDNTRESAVDLKTILGKDGKSIRSTKDEIISEYGLNKKQSETLKNIMNSSSATEEEKQKAAREFAKKANFAVSDNSRISYNEKEGSIEIAEKNVNGERITTVGDKVVLSGGNSVVSTIMNNRTKPEGNSNGGGDNDYKGPNNRPTYNTDYNKLAQKELAVSSVENEGNINTLNTTAEANGNYHVAYNKDGESSTTRTVQLGTLSNTVKDFVDKSPKESIRPDGSIVISRAGTLSDVTKIDVTPKEIKTYHNMDKQFEQDMVAAMEKCSTEEQRIQVRDDMIKDKYGENASFSTDYRTIGQIQITEKNNSNIKSAQVDNNGAIVITTHDNNPIMFKQEQETTRTAHQSSNVVYSALENTTAQTQPRTISADAQVFGGNHENPLDIANTYTSNIGNGQNSENIFIPLQQQVNDDLNRYIKDNSSKYEDNKAGLSQALNDYAFNKYGVQNLEFDNKTKNYVVNAGAKNCEFKDINASYSFKGYDANSQRLIFENNLPPRPPIGDTSHNTTSSDGSSDGANK